MNAFTAPEQTVLYQIANLRSDDHTLTRADVEAAVDVTTLQSLVDKCDVAFDPVGNLVYAPHPRR
jgi:hypothetical protein